MTQEMINETPEEVRCQASRLWVGRNACDDMSVSGLILVFLSVGWIVLLVTAGVRMIYLSNAAARNTDVAKKMQFFQAWFYSFLYTMVSISSIMLVASLIVESEIITALVLIGLFLFSLAYTSQVDVIGTVGKDQGMNPIDVRTMVQYVFTIYLAKAVWKVSGHHETDMEYNKEEKEFQEVKGKNQVKSGFRALLCLSELDNHHRPKVYDFKDVVGIQGAFLSLPTLLVLFIAHVRAYGTDSLVVPEDASKPDYFKYDEFELLSLPLFMLIVSFVSALLTPLLGDWETLKKGRLYSIGSLFFRAIELIGRVLMYAFFVDVTRFAALLVLAFEFVVMWLTTVKAMDTSSAARTDSIGHKILASWEAIFFTRFRRVHVDKEFVLKNTTLMPYTIELIRFVMKTVCTGLGYAAIYSKQPDSFSLSYDYADKNSIPELLVLSFVANGIVILANLVFFLVIKRKKLSSGDIDKLKAYWMTLQPCKFLCTPAVIHLNRDNINFEANGEPIHYV